MRKWRVEDSIELYNIHGWGLDYFSINEKGHITVSPKKECIAIDLKELIDELTLKNIMSPLLIRFPDILDNRIKKISNCFKISAKEYDYKAQNFIIYPIKVNQMRQVVEEIVNHDKKNNIGLEVGSKPELHAVLTINTCLTSLIICNGYKDKNYIRLALLSQKMGKNIFIVVEKLSELELIAELMKKIKIRPNIGIRIKLASNGSGKWEESGGDGSKFGLSSSELLDAIDFITKNKLEDCLRLIHFHIGSQITKIRRIKNAFREASQFYVQLRNLGYKIDFVDIGGGLGVDYDGTRNDRNENSMNYSIQEYVNDSISTLVDVCVKNNIPQPNIITECGRSLTAHHSVLIFQVLETAIIPEWKENDILPDNAHELVMELYKLWDGMNHSRLIETWHDAQQIREESLDLFSLGMLDLVTRSQIEKLYWSIACEVQQMALNMKRVPEELRRISKMLHNKYFCNFSLFRSLPDSWAIDQVFPIVPIAKLDEKPTRTATLQDMTCDSDGKIDNFINMKYFTYHLPVHPINKKESYYIGVFLVGAYQEILGDLHNLFGRTNIVHVSVNENNYQIEQIIEGEKIVDVLEYVQYSTKSLLRTVEIWVKRAIEKGNISKEEGKEFLFNYRSGLYGYTYLE